MRSPRQSSRITPRAEGDSHERMVRRLATARRRFHELAVKEALGQATPADTIKLHRYQALLRYKPSAGERAWWARVEWESERKLKQAKRLLREAAQSPNGGSEPFSPARKD